MHTPYRWTQIRLRQEYVGSRQHDRSPRFECRKRAGQITYGECDIGEPAVRSEVSKRHLSRFYAAQRITVQLEQRIAEKINMDFAWTNRQSPRVRKAENFAVKAALSIQIRDNDTDIGGSFSQLDHWRLTPSSLLQFPHHNGANMGSVANYLYV